jgi:hypothetical protein
MPVSWRIDGAVIVLESDEKATVGEWASALREAGESADWRPGFNVIHDLRRAQGLPGVIDTMLRMEFLIERAQALGAQRYASVIGESQPRGVGQVAEVFAEGKPVQFRVFRDWATAIAWVSPSLGL